MSALSHLSVASGETGIGRALFTRYLRDELRLTTSNIAGYLSPYGPAPRRRRSTTLQGVIVCVAMLPSLDGS
jgi:hypothetical protein